MIRFSPAELRDVTAGHWLVPPPAPHAPLVAQVTDDSRRCGPGTLFVAVRGERVDGHSFLAAAATAGAAALCVERLPDDPPPDLRNPQIPVLMVPDTLAAFHDIARAHRRKQKNLLVIGVTGSNGKTSTKEMIAAILEAAFPGKVLKTDGNTNNHFGVPRNLLRLGPEHRVAVLELGMNQPGEIRALTALAEPGAGVITNIAPAHLEAFGTLEAIAEEKADLFRGLGADAPCVWPAATPCAEVLRGAAGDRPKRTTGENGPVDVRVIYEGYQAESAAYRARFALRDRCTTACCDWPLGGAHQAANAALAVAVTQYLGVPLDGAVAALAGVRLPAMRMRVSEVQGVRYFNDAYNANPASMRAGMQWFAESTHGGSGRRIAVLGDMLELGATSGRLHHETLAWCSERFPTLDIWAVGEAMGAEARRAGLPAFPDAAAAAQELHRVVAAGDAVFLKASRGVRLESLLPAEAR